MICPFCGNHLQADSSVCNACGSALPGPGDAAAAGQLQEYPVGQASPLKSGNNPAYLGKLGSWNWGAAIFTCVWAWFNISPLAAVIAFFAGLAVSSLVAIPVVGVLMPFAVNIFLGIKGNDLAWENRRFASPAEFRTVQTAWAKWGFGLIIAGIVLSGMAFLLFGAFFMGVIGAIFA